MTIRRNLGYAALCAGLLRERLGRCYSADPAGRSYIVNPDMTVTVWDISGDRRVSLSELSR